MFLLEVRILYEQGSKTITMLGNYLTLQWLYSACNSEVVPSSDISGPPEHRLDSKPSVIEMCF